MKMRKVISLLCSLILAFAMSLPVVASEIPKLPSENTSNLEFKIDLSKYPKFNINEYQQYLQIFKDYNIDTNNIIAVIPASEIGAQSNATRAIGVPGGVLVVAGQFLTPCTWRLVVTNAGIVDIKAMEADVQLWHVTDGPILNSQMTLGELSLMRTISQQYTSIGYRDIEFAVVTITGRTAKNEWFNVGGAQYR